MRVTHARPRCCRCDFVAMRSAGYTLSPMRMSMKPLATLVLAMLLAPLHGGAQEAKPLPAPDERYKADILLVVAHPDDEGAATPYLARALDEGKRVAVVFGTHGSSGANEAGSEQAAALGAIREIEARRALATLGITSVWFLGGVERIRQVKTCCSHWPTGTTARPS